MPNRALPKVRRFYWRLAFLLTACPPLQGNGSDFKSKPSWATTFVPFPVTASMSLFLTNMAQKGRCVPILAPGRAPRVSFRAVMYLGLPWGHSIAGIPSTSLFLRFVPGLPAPQVGSQGAWTLNLQQLCTGSHWLTWQLNPGKFLLPRPQSSISPWIA